MRFLFDPHVFLGFDRLVQSIRPLTPLHQTARERIDNDNFTVLDDVILIARIYLVPTKRILNQVGPFHVRAAVQTADVQQLLGNRHSVVRDANLFAFELHDEVPAVLLGRRNLENIVFIDLDGFDLIVGQEVGAQRDLTSIVVARFGVRVLLWGRLLLFLAGAFRFSIA